MIVAEGAIAWSSKKQSTMLLSSCETEYKAITEVVQEAVWVRNLIIELGLKGTFKLEKGITVKMDSELAIRLAKNPEYHAKTKHIHIRYHFIREKIRSGEITIKWVPTREMMADCITKPLPREAFEICRRRYGIITEEEFLQN